MKQLRFFFCVFILLILFVMTSYAQEDVYTNPLETQESTNAKQTGSTVKSDTNDYFGWNLFVNGGIAYDGVTVTSLREIPGSTMGSFYTGTLNYRPQYSAYSFELRYQGINSPYTRMNGFSPTSFMTSHSDFMGLILFRPKADSSGWKNFVVGIGYSAHTRLIDQSITPKTVIDNTLGGPVIAVGNSNPISSKFNYDARLLLKFPNSITEPKQAQTGQYQNGYGAEISFTAVYPYTELLDIGIGVWLQYTTLTFKGTGTRGNSNGIETETMYGVPLELRFKF